jgi:hypothetical protein
VADRVDTAKEAVQAADPHPVLDGFGGEPERKQLCQRDDPVLSRGNPGDENVDFGAFWVHQYP